MHDSQLDKACLAWSHAFHGHMLSDLVHYRIDRRASPKMTHADRESTFLEANLSFMILQPHTTQTARIGLALPAQQYLDTHYYRAVNRF